MYVTNKESWVKTKALSQSMQRRWMFIVPAFKAVLTSAPCVPSVGKDHTDVRLFPQAASFVYSWLINTAEKNTYI